jgi:hypothetical protein
MPSKVKIRARFANKAASPSALRPPSLAQKDVSKLDLRERHELLVEEARKLGFIHRSSKLHQDRPEFEYMDPNGSAYRSMRALYQSATIEMRFSVQS